MSNVRHIEYAAASHKGLIREQNQDNLWCDGVFLECKNDGLPNIITSRAGMDSCPVFALFDGLGGEVAGEHAAWLAARTFDDSASERFEKEGSDFLFNAFDLMNDSICGYADSHHIGHMGTTAAALLFVDGVAIACNLGDSRVYLYRDRSLHCLSVDHVSNSIQAGKRCLTQYLGIRRDLFCIEPAMKKLDIDAQDCFLLCSDGLTDMLSELEIEAVLARSEQPARVVKDLLEGALASGGADNITIIVCTPV